MDMHGELWCFPLAALRAIGKTSYATESPRCTTLGTTVPRATRAKARPARTQQHAYILPACAPRTLCDLCAAACGLLACRPSPEAAEGQVEEALSMCGIHRLYRLPARNAG